MIDKPCDLCGYLYAVYVCWRLVSGGPGKDICESCKREDDKKRKTVEPPKVHDLPPRTVARHGVCNTWQQHGGTPHA